MANLVNIKLLPESVRGMKQLNRDKFLHNVRLLFLKLSTDKLNEVSRKICKPYMLKIPHFKPVQDLNNEKKSSEKCIFLNPEKVRCWNDISENHRLLLKEHDITEDNLSVKEIQLTYNNFSYDTIFKAILPENEETVSGFSQVGHIIHLNLRDHLLEYKTIIGAVFLDKIPKCRTVVNKVHVIDNTFRNFHMELLAGEEDYIVTVKENRCIFQFDFSKVYWNSRLCKEHERILECLKPDDILFDIFCGVGPFAIPAAKRKCKVFANDLNPESYKWLNHNANHNKVKDALFKSYNLDGVEFICTIFKDFIKDYCKGIVKIPSDAKIHVTMNLPGLAVEFLKYFNGLIDEKELLKNFDLNIFVYIYCFVSTVDPVETAKQMVIDKIGRDVSSEILDVVDVRNVAPNKEMMKVTLKLTGEILFCTDNDHEIIEPPAKRRCEENIRQ